MYHENEEWCKIWGGFDLSIQNWYGKFDKFWPENLKISKIRTLMSCFWVKYMFELRGFMFDCTEDWYKIWRQIDLYVLKWHEQFGKFSPEHVRKFKNWVFSWVLLSIVENVWAWKLTGELYAMRMKKDAKFEEELTCQFKIDRSNLMNFESSTWKSQKFAFITKW